MNLDNWANAFLFFTHWPTIFFLSIMSGFFLGFRFFYQTICLVLFNIVCNVALKGLFKVPLSMSLHKIGYAFPSGHMQLASVFYIWLALYVPFKSYRMLLLILLPGIGAALIHFDYHNLIEVCGGLFFGCILVGSYQIYLVQRSKHISLIMFALTSCLMIFIENAYTNMPHTYVWVAYGLLSIILFIERGLSLKI